MDVMQSFAAGSRAVAEAEQSKQDYQSLIGSKQDLKTAYEQETKTDPETGKLTTPDPFKVQNLAAQFAASRGDLKSFELFNKQAQTYKQGNLTNQLKELEVQDNKIAKAEQTLQMMTGPEDALKEIMSPDSPLPMPQRMQIIKDLKQIGDDPVKFKKWQEDHLMKLLPAKEAIAAKRAQMKLENDIQDKKEDNKRALDRDAQTAKYQDGILKSKNNKGDSNSTTDKYRKEDKKTQDDIYKATENFNKEVRSIESKPNVPPNVKKEQIAAAKKSYDDRIKYLKSRMHEKEPEPEKKELKPFDPEQLANITPDVKQELIKGIGDYGKVAEQSFDRVHGAGAAKAIIDEDRAKSKGSWLDTILGGGGSKPSPKGHISDLPRATTEQIEENKKKRSLEAEKSKASIAAKKEQLKEEALQKAKAEKDEEIASAKRKLEVLERQLETAKQKKEPDSIKIKGLMKQISFVKQQINE